MISSTPNWMLRACGIAIALTSAGCLNRPGVAVKTVDPIAQQPPTDEATEFRGARRSVAFYQSGATQGYPTRWYYQPNPDYSTPEHLIRDTAMFMVQTLSLPITLFPDFPFRKVYYAGDVMPPNYSGMPALPPENLHSTSVPDPDPLAAPRAPVLPPEHPLPEQRPPLIVPEPPPTSKPARTRPTSATSVKKSVEVSGPSTLPVR